MALLDYAGGTGWSGHKAPDGSKTNPNNDPTIAASQERLRQYAALTRDQLTNPRVVGQTTTGSGDTQGSQDIVQYDSPMGTIIQYGDGAFRTAEKFAWSPDLSEPMEIKFGEDGKIATAMPKDSGYSLGEQVGDFAGNLATMGAIGLASYGAAAGLGAAAGGAAPAAGGTAGASGGAAGAGAGGAGAGGAVAAAGGGAPGLTLTQAAGGVTAASGAADAFSGGVTADPSMDSAGLAPSGGGNQILDMARRAGQTVADFVRDNPGLVGAIGGGLAGALSGNVDLTNTSNMNRTESSSATRGLADYAMPAGRDYANMAQDTIAGKYLGQGLGTNPYAGQNQFLNSAMDNVSRRMTDAYRDGTASQTMGQFAQGGAFGGSAMRQYQESQNRAFGDSLGSALTGMQMQDYTQQQGLAENQLNRQLSQFQGERNNMMGASGGLANLGGTNTQQATANQENTSTVQGVGPVQGAIAGALGGWAMGNQSRASPSQQPAVGGLGGQPLTLGMQQPQGAVSYNQPGLNNTMLYAGGNPNFYRR